MAKKRRRKQITQAKFFDVAEYQSSGELSSLLQDLDDSMTKSVAFLCPNEIGRTERAINLRTDTDNITLYNPVYSVREDLQLVAEIDVITGEKYLIPRWTKVQLQYQNEFGQPRSTAVLDSQSSALMSQAMDTLDGLRTSDYGLIILPEFEQASDEEKSQVIAAYLDQLHETQLKLDHELQQNEETREIWEANRYLAKLEDGSIVNQDDEAPMSNRKKRRLSKFLKSMNAQINKAKFWKKDKHD